MTKGLLALCGLAALMGGMPASAQDAPPPPSDMDQDRGPPPGAGQRRPPRPLTRPEALAAVQRGFAMLDTDRDGVVTRAEYDAFRQARRQEMMARRNEGDGPDGGADDGRPDDGPRGGPPMHGLGALMSGAHWFDMADADHDGRVTMAEAQGAAMAMFAMLDRNHDGVIDPDERRAAMEMMMRHRAPPQGREDGPPPR